jgi:iron complex outermembrane receptor protein
MKLGVTKLSSAVRLALSLGAVIAAGASGTAFAQDANSQQSTSSQTTTSQTTTTTSQKAQTLSTVVVTGSNIRRVDLETASPVVTIDAADIKASGKLTLGDLINQLPANTGASSNPTVNNGGGGGGSFVSLRGLGTARTLVLVDGQRIANNDLNAIPASMVERIEVLTDGASATYGSDAIGGVVNFILRKNFQGAELTANYGESDHNDGARQGYSFVVGQTTDKGNITAGIDYNQTDGISAADRNFSKSSYQLQSSSSCSAGSVTPYKGYYLCPQGSAATPQGYAFGNLAGLGSSTSGVLNKGVVGKPSYPNDYHNYGTQASDPYNFAVSNLIETPQERTSIFALGNYQLTDAVEAYFHVWHNVTNSSAILGPEPVDIGNAGITVLANSPINPFGVDVGAPYASTAANCPATSNYANGVCAPNAGFAYRAQGQGLRQYNNQTTTDQMVAGLRGAIGSSDWQWDASLNYGHVLAAQQAFGFLNTGKLQASGQLAPTCGTPGYPTCINIFNPQDPTTLSQMQQYYINGSLLQSTYIQRVASLSANGSLFDLPAGSVSLAAGVSYRKESTNNDPDPLYVAPGLSPCDANQLCTPHTVGSFDVKEAYVELLIPILKDVPFAKSLNIDIGSRYSDYNTFGNTVNSKFQVEWRPIDDLLLRGTVSEIFRAPTIGDLYAGAAPNYPGFTDPCGHGGAVGHAGACGGSPDSTTFPGGNPSTTPSGQIPSVVIGSAAAANLGIPVPALKPETGTSFDYGFVYNPSWFDGFSTNVDLWRVIIHNQITAVAPQTAANICYAVNVATNPYCELIQRAASGFINEIYQPSVNLGNLVSSGVDFAFRYKLPETQFGNFSAAFQATYLSQYNNEVAPGLPGDYVVTDAGHYDNNNLVSYPRWRGLGSLNWSLGNWQATYQVQWVGKQIVGWNQIDQPSNAVAGLGPNTTFTVGNYFNQSVTVGYNIEPLNTLVQFGVNNVFDKQPPILGSNNTINANTDPTTYDIIGRYFFARATVKF